MSLVSSFFPSFFFYSSCLNFSIRLKLKCHKHRQTYLITWNYFLHLNNGVFLNVAWKLHVDGFVEWIYTYSITFNSRLWVAFVGCEGREFSEVYSMSHTCSIVFKSEEFMCQWSTSKSQGRIWDQFRVIFMLYFTKCDEWLN